MLQDADRSAAADTQTRSQPASHHVSAAGTAGAAHHGGLQVGRPGVRLLATPRHPGPLSQAFRVERGGDQQQVGQDVLQQCSEGCQVVLFSYQQQRAPAAGWAGCPAAEEQWKLDIVGLGWKHGRDGRQSEDIQCPSPPSTLHPPITAPTHNCTHPPSTCPAPCRGRRCTGRGWPGSRTATPGGKNGYSDGEKAARLQDGQESCMGPPCAHCGSPAASSQGQPWSMHSTYSKPHPPGCPTRGFQCRPPGQTWHPLPHSARFSAATA